MPINDVIQLIQTLKVDKVFRECLYSINKPEQIFKYLEESGYRFTIHEFFETYNMSLVKCQTQDEARLLNEVCNMFLLMLGYDPVTY